MTVVNPKSISGITSITTASGSDNLLTIHTSDANNTERFRIDSTGTTKIVTGIVTTLTATGSAKVGSGVTLSPGGDIFTTGITTVGKSVFLSGQNPNIRFDDSDTTNNGEITLDNTQLRIEVDEDNSRDSSQIRFRVDGDNIATVVSTGLQLTATNPELEFNNGGPRFRVPAANTLSVFTSGGIGSTTNERIRITSGGVSLFGGLTAQADVVDTSKLAVQGGDSNIGIIQVHAGGGETAGDLSGIAFSHGTDDLTSRAKAAVAFRANGSGNGRGDLCFYVDGTEDNNQVAAADEKVRILSTGGITFNGDTATANALDDYEEGDWTPTYEAGSSSITVNAYSIQYGKYVKIGKMVYVEGGLRANVTNNSNGTYDIGGLPFTITNTPNSTGIIHGKEQSSWTVAPDHFSCINNTTKARARGGLTVGANGYTNANSSGFNSGSTNNNRVYFAGWYRVEGA